MYWRKESNKYIYRYRDEAGKHRRVPIKEYVQPEDDKAADRLKGILEARFDEKKTRIKEQKAWHEKYYNFKALVAVFDEERKKQAPNSWKSKRSWFNYVLNYYLNIKQVPNLNEWKFHFEDFRDWLITAKSENFRTKKSLSYASKNHIINELNCFLKIMAKKHKCDPQPKMESFDSNLVDNFRDAESIVTDDEATKIFNELKKLNKDFAGFYYILKETGMRLNEVRGLSLGDVRSGPPPEKAMVKLFAAGGITKIKGYIVLKHQPVERLDSGEMKYKPLKSKPKIANKYNRYIPIIDKRAWDILKNKIQNLKDPYKNRVYGEKLTNYCFWFDSVNKNKFSSVLRKAYANTGIDYKSPHCLRHSKSTYLASLDFTEQLSKMILGHTSKTTQRYIHLKDMMEKTEKVGEFSFDDFE